MLTIHPAIRRITILSAALVGTAACLVGTVSSFWYAIGATPSALYGPQIHRLATMVRYDNVPVEFIGLMWFAAVTLVYLARPPRETSTAYAWVFCSAVPIVGGALDIARGQLRCWGFLIATTAAAIVLIVSGSEEMPPLRSWGRLIVGDAQRLARSPLAVALGFGFVSAAIIGALFFNLKAATVSAAEASDLAFKRWFLSQPHNAASDLAASNAIRVVTFTDYQCPACARTIAQDEAAIESFRRSHAESIEVVYKDFPLDSECNMTLSNEMHPAACEAAVAVRIVGTKLGRQAAHDLGASFYANRAKLSPEYVEARMTDHHLDAEYKRQYADVLKDVAADVALGQHLGVHATPTTFVNGIPMPSLNARNFEMALQYEAERLSGAAVAARPSAGDPRRTGGPDASSLQLR